MQRFNDQLLSTEHELIKDIVYEFDQDAELFLFGPGAKLPGKTVDLYIKSELIDKNTRVHILKLLQIRYRITNVDRICEVNSPQQLETLKFIAENI